MSSLARSLTPRYWPTWIWIGLLRLIVLMPYPQVMAAGRVIGTLVRWFAVRRVRIADLNLQMAYPEVTPADRTQLLKKNFAALGMGLMEIGMGWWWSRERVEKQLVKVDGMENLPDRGDSRGTIFLTAHFSSLELSGRYLGHRYPTYVMYRPSENRAIQTMFEIHRSRHSLGILSRDDVRSMIRVLRDGQGVWFAPDQNFGQKGGPFATFMGIPASSNPATSRFAKITNARVIPFILIRTKVGYRLSIEPELKNFPSDDPQADTQTINDIFTRWAKQAPEQYSWLHRRFRTRPDGGRSPYKRLSSS